MRFVCFSVVMMAGAVTAASVGCGSPPSPAEPRSPDQPLLAPPPPTSPASPPEGNGGTGTGNGLLPETYQANVAHINALMNDPLAKPATSWLRSLDLPGAAYPAGIYTRAQEQNARLLGDMIGCAAGQDQKWSANGLFPTLGKPSFVGEGLLSTTAGWWTAGLLSTADARVDVHTCLVTRLNAYGRRVPIWLLGDHVAGDARRKDDGSEYTFREAVWLALPKDGQMDVYALPLDGLETHCGSKLDDAIKSRICGKASAAGLQYVNACQVKVAPPNLSCTESQQRPAHWTCAVDGKEHAAIETRLKQSDWRKLYNQNLLDDWCNPEAPGVP